MKIAKFDEPELQFGTSCHIDIRFGIMNYCPLDFASSTAPKQIKVGIVGTAASIEGMRTWLIRCRNDIPAKPSRQSKLFPRFPGFNLDTAFHSELLLDAQFEREISSARVEELRRITAREARLVESTAAFVEGVTHIQEKKPVDVIICAIPETILDALEQEEADTGVVEESDEGERKKGVRLDFHHLLKAWCLGVPRACPLQIVLPATYDPTKRRFGRPSRLVVEPLQDEATRAVRRQLLFHFSDN